MCDKHFMTFGQWKAFRIMSSVKLKNSQFNTSYFQFLKQSLKY